MSTRDTFEDESIRAAESGDLRVGERLAEGAEGVVYRLDGDRVVKVYDPEYRTAHRARKISAMVANPPPDPTADQGVRTFVWPSERAETTAGEFLGFVMPYLDLTDRENAQRYARTALNWRRSSQRQRYTTAYNLAAAVGYVHSKGHAMGDMNHENVYVDADGIVTLLDCDAFHISGDDEEFRSSTKHPRYAPPEELPDDPVGVQQTDRFGLAVHIFQFLMEGFHPFQGAGPESTGGTVGTQIEQHRFPYDTPEGGVAPPPAAPTYNRLPLPLQALFERCFLEGKSTPETRPEAAEWMQVLEGLLTDEEPEAGDEKSEEEDTSETESARETAGEETAEPELTVDVEAEAEAVGDLLQGITPEEFVETDGGVGFEFTLPPVDCPVERFRLFVEYTPRYPEEPPTVLVREPDVDPDAMADLVAGIDSAGNVETAAPPGFQWSEGDDGRRAVEMAAKWAQWYCQRLDGASGDPA